MNNTSETDTPYVNGRAVKFYTTRAQARLSGRPVQDVLGYGGFTINSGGKRWFVFLYD